MEQTSRRAFLGLLASLPLLGWLKPSPAEIVEITPGPRGGVWCELEPKWRIIESWIEVGGCRKHTKDGRTAVTHGRYCAGPSVCGLWRRDYRVVVGRA